MFISESGAVFGRVTVHSHTAFSEGIVMFISESGAVFGRVTVHSHTAVSQGIVMFISEIRSSIYSQHTQFHD